jgi:cellulose synthase operon protein C
MAAYRSRDLATAERLPGEFDARTGGDFETHFIMGEIRQKQRDAAGARRHWQHAMLALDGGGAGARTAQARAVRAVVLQRLGYTREAKALYETLLAERPQDRNLRADYVALLLVEGDLRKAREVLGAR